MEDAIRMQEHQGLVDLVQETLSLLWRECGTFFLHVLLEVELEVFEDEIQLILREQHFLKPMIGHIFVYLLNDVRVSEILQKTDFADSGRGDAVVLLLESNFLDSDIFACLQVVCSVDDTIRAFA